MRLIYKNLHILIICFLCCFFAVSCSKDLPKYPLENDLRSAIYKPSFVVNESSRLSDSWDDYYVYDIDENGDVYDVFFLRGFPYDFDSLSYTGRVRLNSDVSVGGIAPFDILVLFGKSLPPKLKDKENSAYSVISEFKDDEVYFPYYTELVDIMKTDVAIKKKIEKIASYYQEGEYHDLIKRKNSLSTYLHKKNSALLEEIFTDGVTEEKITESLTAWAESKCYDETCLEDALLYLSIVGSNNIQDSSKSLFKIYDDMVYRTYAWEAEGYDTREHIRNIDIMTASECTFILSLYYSLLDKYPQVIYSIDSVIALADDIVAVTKNNPVVHSSNPICQIDGVHYEFVAKSGALGSTKYNINLASYEQRLYNFSNTPYNQNLVNRLYRDSYLDTDDQFITNEIITRLLEYYNYVGREQMTIFEILTKKGKLTFSGAYQTLREKFFVVDGLVVSDVDPENEYVYSFYVPARRFDDTGFEKLELSHRCGDIRLSTTVVDDVFQLLVSGWSNYDSSKMWYTVIVKPVD